jgi:hypothetical protein
MNKETIIDRQEKSLLPFSFRESGSLIILMTIAGYIGMLVQEFALRFFASTFQFKAETNLSAFFILLLTGLIVSLFYDFYLLKVKKNRYLSSKQIFILPLVSFSLIAIFQMVYIAIFTKTQVTPGLIVFILITVNFIFYLIGLPFFLRIHKRFRNLQLRE